MILTNETLPIAAAAWQKVLRLQDWDVEFAIVRGRDMGGDRAGECTFSKTKREAIIRLLDPVDYDPAWMQAQDMERTLVHELLHLHFVDLHAKADTPEDIAEERAIDALSGALVTLARSVPS